MNNTYKPQGYNSVSPYFIVDGAQKLIDLLKKIFDAEELRRYDMPDGTIMHAEIRIDDSVLMMGDSSGQFPPNQLLTHIYVKDVDLNLKEQWMPAVSPLKSPNKEPMIRIEGEPLKTFQEISGQ